MSPLPGLCTYHISYSKCKQEAVDKDNSGGVCFDEFCDMMIQKEQNSDPEREILEAFKVFDVDGSGTISCEELVRILTNLGEKVTKEQVEAMIKEVDVDGDGNLDYSELV